MKITCSKEVLAKSVQTIQSALSPRSTLPILLNFLLETEDAKIKVVSTDLEMGVKHYFNAEVESDGSVTIPAKKFAEILGSLPEGSDVELSVDPAGKVHVKSGKSKFWIVGAPKSEYPVLPEFDKAGAFEVDGQALKEMIQKTIFAASTDETRYVLNGVLWQATKGALEMVATDGRRLALISKKDLVGPKADFKVIVPTKILQEFLKIAGRVEDKEFKVLVGISDNQIAFQFEDTTCLSRLVEGTFPNYQQVIPKKSDVVLTVGTKDIQSITRRAGLCTIDRGGSVKYTLRKGSLQVSASSQTVEFEDEIPVDYDDKEFAIAFNPAYLQEALKNVGSNQVKIGMTTPINPVLIEPEDDGDYKFVVMPMRA